MKETIGEGHRRLVGSLVQAFDGIPFDQPCSGSEWRIQHPDLIGMEVELQILLYGLIVSLKPELVVETGCHRGGTSEVIAAALNANNKGSLILTDIDPSYLSYAAGRVREHWGLLETIRAEPGRLLPEIASCLSKADIVLIDSGHNSRVREMDHLKRGSVALIHDTIFHAHVGAAVREKFPRRVELKTERGAALVWV